MRFEVERKFLVADDGWRSAVVSRRRLTDGLIGRFETGSKVRVRLDEDRAWLTVKGARSGITRAEFEYAIPLSDAERLLSDVCTGHIVEKDRQRQCQPDRERRGRVQTSCCFFGQERVR